MRAWLLAFLTETGWKEQRPRALLLDMEIRVVQGRSPSDSTHMVMKMSMSMEMKMVMVMMVGAELQGVGV